MACRYRWNFVSRGSPQNPPVLFLHGFLGSGQEWLPILEKLVSQFYGVAIDLPGYGTTVVEGGEDCYAMPQVAAGLADWVEHFFSSPPVVCGYSMGGRLALYLLVFYPHLFTAGILESASPGLRTAAERAARRQRDNQLAQQLEHLSLTEFLKFWYRQPLFASLKNHPRMESLFRSRLQNNPQELAKSLRRMGTGQQPSLWPHLKKLKKPLLLLAGALDSKFCLILNEMKLLLPQGELRIVEECGHNIHFEKPEEFVNILHSYLNQLEWERKWERRKDEPDSMGGGR